MNNDFSKNIIVGKTYSLYSSSNHTEGYFREVNILLEKLLNEYSSKEELLLKLRSSEKKVSQTNIFHHSIEPGLSKYITGLDKHLLSLPIHRRFNSVLSKKKFQYLLNMLEIALVNRINKSLFLNCEKKMALLPHCLRDLSRKCMSKIEDIDYVCRFCSKNCFINKASRLLLDHNIKPYIWREASRKVLFSKRRQKTKSLGILGIACIPELLEGLRLCAKKNIPAVGLPLDANRCARWMGDFYENSINLNELEKLITE